jgi:hypothetical protein
MTPLTFKIKIIYPIARLLMLEIKTQVITVLSKANLAPLNIELKEIMKMALRTLNLMMIMMLLLRSITRKISLFILILARLPLTTKSDQ